MTQRPVGLLGGTFDPIHFGHLEMAEAAMRVARLEKVYFVTSVHPPHKMARTHATSLDRHAMVALALLDKPGFVPSSVECERAGQSYSIDTVRHLKRTLGPATPIFFLIGMDAFWDFATWKDYELLPQLCSFLIFARPGFSSEELSGRLPASIYGRLKVLNPNEPLGACAENGIYLYPDFANDISSTVIRQHIQAGQNVDRWVPAPVREYIQKAELYLN
ncbi:MAG: nicotinate-nucleotide adenylyltransferase [Acidobacteriota bacterium]